MLAFYTFIYKISISKFGNAYFFYLFINSYPLDI